MANKRQLKKAMASCVSEAMLEAYLQLNFNKEFNEEKCSEVVVKANTLYTEAAKAMNFCSPKFKGEESYKNYVRKTYTNLITKFNDGIHEIETLLGRKAE